ncbi:hypothetical protein [Paraburkholderia sp. RL17-373-BIF-A]|uniref:hypothetical protein n=1 Tax=Paraburkholderia sp. RL17-373-BIF-A TaxID=3031629 RepID=UPI0038B76666
MMFEDNEVAVAIWEWFWRKGITHFVGYAPETVGLKIQDSRSRFVVADQDRHWSPINRRLDNRSGVVAVTDLAMPV